MRQNISRFYKKCTQKKKLLSWVSHRVAAPTCLDAPGRLNRGCKIWKNKIEANSIPLWTSWNVQDRRFIFPMALRIVLVGVLAVQELCFALVS